MYSIVTIVNNMMSYTWNLLRINWMFSLQIKKKMLTMWDDGCINSTVKVILQCIHISNYHTVHLKYIFIYQLCHNKPRNHKTKWKW